MKPKTEKEQSKAFEKVMQILTRGKHSPEAIVLARKEMAEWGENMRECKGAVESNIHLYSDKKTEPPKPDEATRQRFTEPLSFRIISRAKPEIDKKLNN